MTLEAKVYDELLGWSQYRSTDQIADHLKIEKAAVLSALDALTKGGKVKASYDRRDEWYAVPEIPDISDERLLELASRIKPLMRGTANLYFVKPYKPKDMNFLRNQSFIWSAKKGSKAKVDEPRKSIRTFHTCGYPGLFKPSVAEVLCQIPEEDLAWVKAFLVEDDLDRNNIHPSGSFQFTQTHLFD